MLTITFSPIHVRDQYLWVTLVLTSKDEMRWLGKDDTLLVQQSNMVIRVNGVSLQDWKVILLLSAYPMQQEYICIIIWTYPWFAQNKEGIPSYKSGVSSC